MIQNNGRARLAKWKPQKVNEIPVDTGNTRHMNADSLKKLSKVIILKGGAWRVWESFVFRENAKNAAKCYADIVFHSKVTNGYTQSNFHISKVDLSKFYTDGDGIRCINCEMQFDIQLHSDGGPVHNIPREYRSMTVAWAKFNILQDGFDSSWYDGIPMMLSAMNEDSQQTNDIIDILADQLAADGDVRFPIHGDPNNTFMCVSFKRISFAGDLKARNKMSTNSITVAGDYGLPQGVILTPGDEYPLKGLFGFL